MWHYQGREFTEEQIGDNHGFVYQITNRATAKKYIGKKFFWSTRRLPPLKGKTRRRVKKVLSDWMDYYGSSEELKLLVEKQGRDMYHREILRLCKTKVSVHITKRSYNLKTMYCLKMSTTTNL